MWRKCYPSMYEGSMVGSGACVFAVWGYVIAKQEPDKEHGAKVRLNPKLLALIIGESEKDISDAIDKLCDKDENSTTSANEGRRLVRLAEFDYQVVNGEKYMALRSTEKRRTQLREAQVRYRIRKKASNPAGDRSAVAAMENGASDQQLDSIAAESLQIKRDETQRLNQMLEEE